MYYSKEWNKRKDYEKSSINPETIAEGIETYDVNNRMSIIPLVEIMKNPIFNLETRSKASFILVEKLINMHG